MKAERSKPSGVWKQVRDLDWKPSGAKFLKPWRSPHAWICALVAAWRAYRAGRPSLAMVPRMCWRPKRREMAGVEGVLLATAFFSNSMKSK